MIIKEFKFTYMLNSAKYKYSLKKISELNTYVVLISYDNINAIIALLSNIDNNKIILKNGVCVVVDNISLKELFPRKIHKYIFMDEQANTKYRFFLRVEPENIELERSNKYIFFGSVEQPIEKFKIYIDNGITCGDIPTIYYENELCSFIKQYIETNKIVVMRLTTSQISIVLKLTKYAIVFSDDHSDYENKKFIIIPKRRRKIQTQKLQRYLQGKEVIYYDNTNKLKSML